MADVEITHLGWGWPANSRKAHYFFNSYTSMCGGWLFRGHVEQGNDDSIDNCAECKKRLKKHLSPPKGSRTKP